MVVYVLENAPQRLRGVLSRYCLEVRAGLFVARLDARMRELLWEKIETLSREKTRGVMIWRESSAQGFAFRTIGDDRRVPIIIDGIWLIAEQPNEAASVEDPSAPKTTSRSRRRTGTA